MNDRDFLFWLRDRLVHVYGESPNVDFISKLESVAMNIPPDKVSANMGERYYRKLKELGL